MNNGKETPQITLCPVATAHAILTEATIPAADDQPSMLVGFMLHVPGNSYYRVFTASGNLYGVHMDEAIAVDDLRTYAAQLMRRRAAE